MVVTVSPLTLVAVVAVVLLPQVVWVLTTMEPYETVVLVVLA